MADGSSQARGPIGAVDAGLHHSHSNAGSELCLQPTPQLTATLDPYPMSKAREQTRNLMVPRLDSLTTEPRWELPPSFLILHLFLVLSLFF